MALDSRSKQAVDIREIFIDRQLETNFPGCRQLSDLFAEAVLCQAGIELPRRSYRAKCSPRREKPDAPKGQTDIGLYFSDEKTEAVLLVENKIFSPFTARQPERYREEADWLVQAGHFAHAVPVLLCPARYRDRARISAAKFPVCVTYEQLAERLPQEGRYEVVRAIKRCETGLITFEVPAVGNCFEGYKFLLKQLRPDITMITSEVGKGGRARTVRFSINLVGGGRSRDNKITLLHQWQEGRAKILLDNSRRRADSSALEQLMQHDGNPFGMKLDPNGSGSVGLFLPTPQIVNDGEWDGQIEAAIIGIEKVGLLADWLCGNPQTWRKWL